MSVENQLLKGVEFEFRYKRKTYNVNCKTSEKVLVFNISSSALPVPINYWLYSNWYENRNIKVDIAILTHSASLILKKHLQIEKPIKTQFVGMVYQNIQLSLF